MSAIKHRTKVKCRIEGADGAWVERIPAWIKWATQEWNEVLFNGVYYAPPEAGFPGEVHPLKSYTVCGVVHEVERAAACACHSAVLWGGCAALPDGACAAACRYSAEGTAALTSPQCCQRCQACSLAYPSTTPCLRPCPCR